MPTKKKMKSGMKVAYDDGRNKFIGILGPLVSSTKAQIRPIDGYSNDIFDDTSWVYTNRKYMKLID